MTTISRRITLASLVCVAIGATAACGGGKGFDSGSSSAATAAGSAGGGSTAAAPAKLTVLIASSGDAETNAVKAAADAWATKTANTVTVTPAQDIKQQLGQGFAAGSPPDVFYVDAGAFADYASTGALEPYAETVADKDDFYPSLRQSFTYKSKLYCIPKDFSTLALEINTAAWAKAGLTDADVPKTWDQLSAVAKKLTVGTQVGSRSGTPGTGSARSWSRPAAGW